MRKVILTMNEEKRFELIKKLVDTKGNKKNAALKLGCSERHINRLIIGYKQEGKGYFKHGNKGRQPSHALSDIDTNIGLMHTFFALEDMRGLKIGEVDGEVVLRLDKSDYSTYSTMDKMLRAWLAEAKKLESGEITKEEYDEWRYKYPELDTHQIWAKVYPQELFDFIAKR